MNNRSSKELIEFYFGLTQLLLGTIAVILVGLFLWSLFP